MLCYHNTMKIEIKNIPNWHGYQATSDGCIISLPNHCHKKSIILKPSKNKDGYFHLVLYKNGKKYSKLVHTLIALVFLSEKPTGLVTNHIDHDVLNNNISNLEYISQRANVNHGNEIRQCTSQYPGVSFRAKTNNWIAHFVVNNKTYHLGTFKTEIQASNIYQIVLKIHESNGDTITFIKTNCSPKQTSKFKGVCWHKRIKKWYAQKTKNSKRIAVGYFTSEIAAYNARINA